MTWDLNWPDREEVTICVVLAAQVVHPSVMAKNRQRRLYFSLVA
ncbi:hypothetical protein [Streptomyces sp. NPDC001980]